MAEQTPIHTKRDGIITISDDGDVHEYVIAFEAGDFSVTPGIEAKTLILDRGVIGAVPSVRLGDQTPTTFSFTAYLRELSNDSEAVLRDIVNWTGFVGTDWVSTHPASDVKMVTIRYTIDGSALGLADKTMRLDYCVLEEAFAESDNSTISISGTSFQLKPVVE